MQLSLTDDFDPDKIISCGQCFRPRRLPDGRYRFVTGRSVLSLSVPAPGALRADCPPEDWEAVWRPYFDLDRDYRAIRSAVPPDDPFLQKAAREGAGLRVLRQDPWETLVSFIISQRKSIPAIRTAVEKLCAVLGEPLGAADGETTYSFPRPEAVLAAPAGALESCSLGYRLPYVLDAAEKVASGALDLAALDLLPDDGILDALKAVRGVGVKVASCVSLFSYGRCGCAPVDVWISRVIRARYGGENPFCAYGENAGVMQQYLFYYALLHKGEF